MIQARAAAPYRRLDLRQFECFCLAEAARMERHGEAYVRKAVRRFWESFRICSERITPGANVLSVGAGGAYVEKMLADRFGARVTAIDFPRAVEEHREDYARYGIRGVGRDLACDWQLDHAEPFDMALSFEVLEHLPIPPHQHIQSLGDRLRPGGYLVLSTPNFARLTNVVRLLLGAPVLADPRLTFQPTRYEQEHVHRREYVPAELIEAIRHGGLTHVKTVYHLNLGPFGTSPGTLLLRLACRFHRRFRNIVFIVAQK